MSRGPSTFRQTDLTRAVKGAEAGGMKVARIEIGIDGKIVLIASAGDPEPQTALDQWKAKRDARSA